MSTGKRKAVFDGHVSLICTNTCHHLNPSPCNRQNGGPGMRKKRRKSEKKKATLPSHTHTPAHLLYFYSQQFGTTYMQRAIKYQTRRSSWSVAMHKIPILHSHNMFKPFQKEILMLSIHNLYILVLMKTMHNCCKSHSYSKSCTIIVCYAQLSLLRTAVLRHT